MALTDVIHEAVAEFDAAYAAIRAKLMVHARDLEATAGADTVQLAEDAVTGGPVVADAAHDAEALATTVVADLTAAAAPSPALGEPSATTPVGTTVALGDTGTASNPAPAPVTTDPTPAPAAVADVTTPAPPTA